MNAIALRILQRHRNLLLMGGAVLCGAIAVYAGSRYVNERVQEERARLVQPAQQMIDVVVARLPLQKGDVISADTMALRSVPVDFVPSHAVRPEQFDVLVGQQLSMPLASGEFLSTMAVAAGEQLMFSSRVKPGIRALTISVDEINSISGMLQPGDRIDLLLSARPPASHGGADMALERTVPLLQNLLVLATGHHVRPGIEEDGETRRYSAVTVEVDPKQAQRLVVAQRAGRLTAILRNPEDNLPMNTAAIDIRHLFDLPQPVEPKRMLRRTASGPQIIIGGMGQAGSQPMKQHVLPASASVPSAQTGQQTQQAQPGHAPGQVRQVGSAQRRYQVPSIQQRTERDAGVQAGVQSAAGAQASRGSVEVVNPVQTNDLRTNQS
ncbi:MAG: Flp pilus assembly protein CpaB [Lautropia sp.]|nr:Flp pilus assembly protein CpaB [Lautropia sp.]